MLSFKQFLVEMGNRSEINDNMSLRDLVKHVEKSGWTKEREGGGHVVYGKSGSKEKIALPHKHAKELSPGLVRKTLRMIDGTANIR